MESEVVVPTSACMRHRMRSDRGSVGILMALVMFFVAGMLVMTWNTYTLSREKMRLQNAVDAAALEHAVWQARGMNALQNLNDEGYDTMMTAQVGYCAGVVVMGLAQALSAIPVVGWILYPPFFAIGVILMDVSTWTLEVVLTFIKVAQKFWQYGTCPIAYLAALQAAGMNGARGMIAHFAGAENFTYDLGLLGKISLDLTAIGLSLSPKDTFMLPVEEVKKEDSDWPWQLDLEWGNTFRFLKTLPVIGDIIKVAVWLPDKVPGFNPIVSKSQGKDGKDAKLPSPTLWVCISPYPSYDSVKGFDKWLFAKENAFGTLDNPWKSYLPIMAYAVGQCVTGDIIETTTGLEDKLNPLRPRGWGVGANAKLISLEEALTLTKHPTLKKLAGILFYH